MICISKRHVFFYLSIFVSLTAVLMSCGKKAPPVPPQRYRPPAVSDLSYRLIDSTLRLDWTLPEIEPAKKMAFGGCTVFRANTSLSESDCPTCPPKFKSIAELKPGTTGQTQENVVVMNYSETLARGYRYTYKVNCYPAKGGYGQDSNTVEFIY
jgi:hypothetical protein